LSEDFMRNPLSLAWLLAAPALLALTASAQVSTPAAPASSPRKPGAVSAALLPYRSALAGYQPFGDEKPQPWKAANDTAANIGGWRSYAKQAREPDPKDEPPPAQAPASNPHAGHHKP
jgi:hypothetical protein